MAKKSVLESVFLGPCPMCGRKLRHKHTDEVGVSAGGTALYCVSCAFCKSSVLLNISRMSPDMTAAVGILTDMQKEDGALLKQSAAVRHDDVLSMHSFLEN